MDKLSHLNERDQPEMVDVGDKLVTRRTATAVAYVRLNERVLALLSGGELHSKKGPVFQTASLAGMMAAKRTDELIPLCHVIPLETCKVGIEIEEETGRARVTAFARATHKTGVEMEALTAASVAALTIYDMCKALGHDLVIEEVKLVEKTGGKSDYKAGA